MFNKYVIIVLIFSASQSFAMNYFWNLLGIAEPEEKVEDNWEILKPEHDIIDNRNEPQDPNFEAYFSSEEDLEILQKPEEIIDYNKYLIEPRHDANFNRYFKLHKILWEASTTYQTMWCAIVEETATPMSIISTSNFTFEAYADINNSRLAIVINNSEPMPDHVVGTLIAFELTNIFQRQRLYDIDTQARQGYYRNNYGAQEALRFAYDKEQVENIRGKELHNDIIKEALSRSEKIIGQQWFKYHIDYMKYPFYAEFSEYISANDNTSHINYYRDFYDQFIKPELESSRKKELLEFLKKSESTGEEENRYEKGPSGWVERKNSSI